MGGGGVGGCGGTVPTTGASAQLPQPPTNGTPKSNHAKDYKFLDIELKYGILQIIEALSFLHYSGHVIHKNVCPSSILVTKKGTWKLAGLEFIGNNKTPSRGWCWW